MKRDMNITINIHVHQAEDSEECGRDTHLLASKAAEAIQNVLQQAETQKSSKTYANYLTAVRSFLRFLESEQVGGSINAATIEHYGRWLQLQGVCLNTVSCYMRSLRSVLSRIDEASKLFFQHVFTGSSKTEKRAINEQVITTLQTLELKQGSFLSLARDIFLFCFFAQGMPFVDAARLRQGQIKDNDIVYDRHKTHQRVVVRLEPCMQTIIDRYSVPGRDYVFPLFTTHDEKLMQHEYTILLNRYNRALKTLARRAGVNVNLTSYVARHSWASIAFKSSIELPVISKALGHTNPQTTMVYIKEIDDCRLREANHLLLEKFERMSGENEKKCD